MIVMGWKAPDCGVASPARTSHGPALGSKSPTSFGTSVRIATLVRTNVKRHTDLYDVLFLNL
jgi:hypothetical protein